MTMQSSEAVPWEVALMRSWHKLALICVAALAGACVIWQLQNRAILYGFIFQPSAVPRETIPARHALLPMVAVAAVVAAALCLRALLQARRGVRVWSVHWELLCGSLIGLPILTVPEVEFEHPLFTAVLILVLSLAVAFAVKCETATLRALPDLTRRQAQIVVGAAYATFVSVIGFISYWRYITFHAELCDASYEVNSVAGIVRHGYPTLSVAAFFYDGKPLPGPYFINHVPFSDYLFAPFFAVYPHPGSVFWAQVVLMGTGAFGAYLIGFKWLGSRWGGALMAWLYVLTPEVQGFCLHDIHANVMALPCILLAVGFMDIERYRTALLFAGLTAISREETPLYAIGLGLYWMFSSEERIRFRAGLLVVIVSAGLEVFFSAWLMPHFGGHPRWDHFDLFFDGSRNGASLIGALLLNPLGALFSSTAEVKLEFFAICFVSYGFLALWGWRAAFFLVPFVLLTVPSGDPNFFMLGVNYSAPLAPAALLMSFAGLRHVWMRDRNAIDAEGVVRRRQRRRWLTSYVLASALLGNYLYGNIASKTYKIEYGQSPVRRDNQRNYKDIIGYTEELPPYGEAERLLWEVIDRVPKNVPVLTSWIPNPAFAGYDIALAYYSGGNPPPEERVRFAVFDKLPGFMVSNEGDVARLRSDHRHWKVFFENASGVVFERISH